MSELKESNSIEKKENASSELGKVAEKLTATGSEIGKSFDDALQLSEDELNEPIDITSSEKASLDCRSECKYNTGDRSKYSNYGYSD